MKPEWPIIDDLLIDKIASYVRTSCRPGSSNGRLGCFEENEGLIYNFEQKICQHYGCKGALLVNSGFSANFLAYMLAGIKPGDEIICSNYGFIATVAPAYILGATPVFIDVLFDRPVMDPEIVLSAITERTKAIIVTHPHGFAADIEKLYEIANTKGIILIEDCAQSPTSSWKNKYLGTFGRFGCFSMNELKMTPAGEGGYIIFKQYDDFLRAISLINHYKAGWYKGEFKHYGIQGYMGINIKIHPLAAVIGLHFFDSIKKYQEIRKIYAHNLESYINQTKLFGYPVRDRGIEQDSWYEFLLTSYESKHIRDIIATLQRYDYQISQGQSRGPLWQLYSNFSDTYKIYSETTNRYNSRTDFFIARSAKISLTHKMADYDDIGKLLINYSIGVD